MGIRARLRPWTSHDPLLQGRPDADPRLRESSNLDPNAGFLADRSQGQPGNQAGPELAVYRAVRWLTRRRRG